MFLLKFYFVWYKYGYLISFHVFVTRNIFFHPFLLTLRVSLKLNESLSCLFVFYLSNYSVHFVGEFNLFLFRVIIDMWRLAWVCHFTYITLCYKFFLFFVIFTRKCLSINLKSNTITKFTHTKKNSRFLPHSSHFQSHSPEQPLINLLHFSLGIMTMIIIPCLY